ncbi:Amidase [Ensifer sp. OV372]|nr:Amidase [Ensifer sp. OV372]
MTECWSFSAKYGGMVGPARLESERTNFVQGADVGAPHYLPPYSGSFLDAVRGPSRILRIAVSSAPMLGGKVEPEVLAAFADATKLLSDLGHEVVEAAPQVDAEAFSLSFLTMLAAELRVDMEDAADAAGVPIRVEDFDASTIGMGLLGQAFSASDLAKALRYLKLAARGVSSFFETRDVLMTPVLSRLPPPIGALQPSPQEKTIIRAIGRAKAGWLLRKLGIAERLAADTFAFMPWTPVFNVTGQPAMSVPLFWTDGGLPIGTHFVGRFGDEATLFELAGQLERARPWSDREPPLCR